ncbi:MAG: hypothetical protein Q4E89_13290 [Eubacteriales bacterium]|nr:hypothetical protein [Eubacteriales bacterium]
MVFNESGWSLTKADMAPVDIANIRLTRLVLRKRLLWKYINLARRGEENGFEAGGIYIENSRGE